MIRAAFLALLAFVAVPAAALDRGPPAQRSGPIAITGPGSTGDVSGMSVTQPGLVARSLVNKLSERPSVQDAGAICDGTTDAGPTINAILALGLKQISVPKGAVCRSSVTINIPGAATLEGTGFSPGNPATGSTILCDAGVSPCVRIGNQQQPFGASLRRMIVRRAGGQPTADKIGVLIDGDYNPIMTDVAALNHGQGFVFRITGPAGLGGQFARLYSGQISDAHIVQDGWPELRISHSRFGMSGGGDYAANTYVRIQGGVSGSAAGPNTLTVQNTQFNQSANAHHMVEFVNLAASVPNVDAVEFDFDNVHVEAIDQAVFYSDATWNIISRSHVTNSTFNTPGAAFFALNPATTFDDYSLIGNHIYVTDLTLSPTNQLNNFKMVGNHIAAPVSIAAGAVAGATANLSSNTLVGNLTLSGTWGSLNVFGTTWISGKLVNNALGNVAIADAVNGGFSPTKSKLLYGRTDASGNASIAHGLPGSTQFVTANGVLRGNSGEAIVLTGMGTPQGITAIDGGSVYVTAGSGYANRAIRIKLEYQTTPDTNWN